MATVGTLSVNVLANTGPARVSLLGLRTELSGLPSYLRGLTATLAPIGAGLGFHALIQQARDFRREMTQSTAILDGVTAGQQAKMEQTAQRVAFDTKVSAAEAAKGFFYLGQSGLTAEQSIASLPTAANFAQTGLIDLGRATELLLDSQSAMGLKVADATENMQNMARVSDVLTKASMMSQGEIEQFAAALANGAAASARIAGHDLEQVVAVLTAFHEQGAKGEEAGTAYSIVMRDLQTKALENSAAFEAAGVSVFDAGGELRNTADIVRDLQQGLTGLSDAAKKQFILDLGITDKSVKNVQILLGSADKIRDYETALRGAQGVTGEVASRQLPAFEQALHRSKVAAGNFAARVIDPGLDKFGRLVLGAQDSLRGLHGETAANTAKLAVFAATLGAGLLIFPRIVTGVLTIVRALRAMATAQALTQALAGPAGWATLAVSVGVAAAAVYGVDQAFAGLDAQLASHQVLTAQVAKGNEQQAATARQATQSFAAQQEALAALTNRGKQLAEELRTPGEVLEDSLVEFEGLLSAGAISWDTYSRAVNRAVTEFRDLNAEKDAFDEQPIGAAEKGTTAGFSAAQAGRRELDKLARMRDEAQRTQREVERILAAAASRAAGQAAPAAAAFAAANQTADRTAQRAAAALANTAGAVDQLGRRAQALAPRLDLRDALKLPDDRGEALDPFRARVNALNEDVQRGRISWEEYDRAVQAAAAERLPTERLPAAPPPSLAPPSLAPEVPIRYEPPKVADPPDHEKLFASVDARINALDAQVAAGTLAWSDYDRAVQAVAESLRSLPLDVPQPPPPEKIIAPDLSREVLEMKLPELRPPASAPTAEDMEAKEEQRRQTSLLEQSAAEEKAQTAALNDLRTFATRGANQPAITVNQVSL